MKNQTVKNNLLQYHCFNFIFSKRGNSHCFWHTVLIFDKYGVVQPQPQSRCRTGLSPPNFPLASLLLSTPLLAATGVFSVSIALAFPQKRLSSSGSPLRTASVPVVGRIVAVSLALPCYRSGPVCCMDAPQFFMLFRLKDMWVVSSWGQFWVTLLCTCTYRSYFLKAALLRCHLHTRSFSYLKFRVQWFLVNLQS